MAKKKRLRIQGTKPLTKLELSKIAGVSIETLNRERKLGRLTWTRNWEYRGIALIENAEARRWLAERIKRRKLGLCK